MDQKFVTFDDALEKLGVSADKLNELREAGQLRAYRDGSSWKFRGDEIQKMMDEGVPEPAPPSDIGLVDEDDLVDAEPLSLVGSDDDLELQIDDDDDTKISAGSAVPTTDSELEIEPPDTDTESSGSELELAELDDTVTAGASDLLLDENEAVGPSDSILLSEEELGESVSKHGSTVIGKDEGEDADLELELADDDDVLASQSDVKLAGPGASDVLSSKIAGSGVLDTETSDSGPGASAFEDLDELEIDLAAESSRILDPVDADQSQAAEQPKSEANEDSDLRLEDDGIADDSNMGSTDVPLLELEDGGSGGDEGSGGEIELASDSELDLGDGSGSDITLDSGDSGINLSPADSGLALDDIPLDIGGSAILSSLSLGGDSDPEISLLGDADEGGEASASASLQTDDDFQLTPLSEGAAETDGDSSSQVIALDAEIEELGASAVAEFEEVDLTEDAGDEAVVLTEDFDDAPAGDFDTSYSPAPVAAASDEQPYNWVSMLLLGSTTLFLMLASVMMLDVLRNIWTWNEEFSVSSDLMDALLGAFGLG